MDRIVEALIYASISIVALVLIVCIVVVAKRAKTPTRTVSAIVVSKRTSVVLGMSVFYITFEFEDGQRKELSVNSPKKFGMVVEGDRGKLIYKAETYIDLVRE